MPDILPGRSYDVAILTGTPVGGMGLQAVSALDPSWPQGRGVTGIQKLAQRVIMELLTEAGSIPYSPDRGTGFMTALRAGWLTTDAAVFQQFAFAANAIIRNLGLEATASDPADELLADLELDSVLFAPGQLALSFTLTTAAGTSASYILPVGAEP